jgi:hypothetical protein
MTTVPTFTAGELAAATRGDGSLLGIPLSGYPYQVAGGQFTEWMCLQLSGDSPAILLSCPPEAEQDGEVKLTAAEALQLAGALVSLACRAGHGTAYAPGDPSPCCPGDELAAYLHPTVWCPECGSKYTRTLTAPTP